MSRLRPYQPYGPIVVCPVRVSADLFTGVCLIWTRKVFAWAIGATSSRCQSQAQLGTRLPTIVECAPELHVSSNNKTTSQNRFSGPVSNARSTATLHCGRCRMRTKRLTCYRNKMLIAEIFGKIVCKCSGVSRIFYFFLHFYLFLTCFCVFHRRLPFTCFI